MLQGQKGIVMWKCLNRNESRSRTGHLRTLARMSALALLASASAGGCGANPSEVDEASDPTGSGADSTTTTTLALAVEAGGWKRLGDNLNPTPTEATSPPSLAFDEDARPVVGFSRRDASTNDRTIDILKWRGHRWRAAGPTLAGGDPKIAIDSQDRVVVCLERDHVADGPFVQRLSESTWTALGGSVAAEAGYKDLHYALPSCGGVVIDEWDGPNITWTAHYGSRIWYAHAARWSRSQQLWRGLESPLEEQDGYIRGVNYSAAIDGENRVYLATHQDDWPHDGDNTTMVWRHDDDGWEELGPKMADTVGQIVAVSGDSTPYLAFLNLDEGEPQNPRIPQYTIYVKRWSDGAWQDLPSPGIGTNLSLGFTPSGRPVLAYFDFAAPNLIRVKHLADGAWVELGNGLPVVVEPHQSALPKLDLKVDPRGRATVAWTQGGAALGGFTLFVDRYDVALP
jgi:hypothetical protein